MEATNDTSASYDDLLKRRPATKDDETFVPWARECFELRSKEQLTSQQITELMGEYMGASSIRRHVLKCSRNGNVSPYQGPDSHRPGYMERDEDVAEIAHHLLNAREKRNMSNEEDFNRAVRRVVQNSQRTRNVKVVDDAWVPSKNFSKKIKEKMGASSVKPGHDSIRRTRAMLSARNFIWQLAMLMSLVLPQFTPDALPVHPRLVGNFDATTIFQKKENGKAVTIAKPTPLIESDAELTAAYAKAKLQPATVSGDGELSQVRTLFAFAPQATPAHLSV